MKPVPAPEPPEQEEKQPPLVRAVIAGLEEVVDGGPLASPVV